MGPSHMKSFLSVRGLGLGAVVLIMLAVSLAQASISYTLSFGALRKLMPDAMLPVLTTLVTMRFGLVLVMAVLWTLNRKIALFRVIIASNAMFTLALLGHTSGLIAALFGSAAAGINALMSDVLLMVVSNILIFSVWYWIIDPPGVDDIPRDDEPWDFLFPQRGSSLPHYEAWVPRYADYLFVAFTTSFAFSPTDTLPLTTRAKMLMLLQASISIVTLTGIAGSAINILAGAK
jgi:hypothetical protein